MLGIEAVAAARTDTIRGQQTRQAQRGMAAKAGAAAASAAAVTEAAAVLVAVLHWIVETSTGIIPFTIIIVMKNI